MRLFIGFEGWKAVAEVFCGIVLIFSFAGKDIFGKIYISLLFITIFIIAISTFCMIISRYLECKDLKINNN